jgi:hypothetical protein
MQVRVQAEKFGSFKRWRLRLILKSYQQALHLELTVGLSPQSNWIVTFVVPEHGLPSTVMT